MFRRLSPVTEPNRETQCGPIESNSTGAFTTKPRGPTEQDPRITEPVGLCTSRCQWRVTCCSTQSDSGIAEPIAGPPARVAELLAAPSASTASTAEPFATAAPLHNTGTCKAKFSEESYPAPSSPDSKARSEAKSRSFPSGDALDPSCPTLAPRPLLSLRRCSGLLHLSFSGAPAAPLPLPAALLPPSVAL
jgi:hypothetical protein